MSTNPRLSSVSKLSVSVVIGSFFLNIVLVPSGFTEDRLSSKKSGLISRYYSVDQVMANSILDKKEEDKEDQIWKRLTEALKKKTGKNGHDDEIEAAPPAGKGGGGKDKPPAVSNIGSNAIDVDPSVAGEQILKDTIVTYSATASDPEGKTVSWQWKYSVNGGAAVTHSSGSGQVQSATYNYANASVPSTYNWSLTVTDGVKTTTKSYATYVVSSTPPPPGPLALLYLDFDGDFSSSWGSYSNIDTPAYDQDGNTSSFSAGEMATISEILQRVAEKFSPFNLMVKSNFDYAAGEAPTVFNNKEALQVIIGGSGAWLGQSAGGVAYVNSFTNSIDNAVYVFENNLGNGNAKYTAEAVAHEAGHAFGLHHHSAFDANGVKTAEYDQGTSLVAPNMGVAYYSARGLWANAPSTSYTSIQDDLAILTNSTNGFGYKADDYGNTLSAAYDFVFGNSYNGIIEKSSDTDLFKFSTLGGAMAFNLSVADFGAMLDSRLELWDTAGNMLFSNDPTNTSSKTTLGAALNVTLAAGDYFLSVESHGGYGDIGQYRLLGSLL